MSVIEPVHQQNSAISVIVNQDEYISELRNYYSKLSKFNKKLEWTNQRIQDVIKLLDEFNANKSQGRRLTNQHYHYARKYEVKNINDQKVLIMKRKKVSNPTVQIIPTEEYYEKILNAHISTKHGRRDKIIQTLKYKYLVPIFAVTIFLNLCKTCLAKKSLPKKEIKTLISGHFNQGEPMDLDFQTSPDKEYVWMPRSALLSCPNAERHLREISASGSSPQKNQNIGDLKSVTNDAPKRRRIQKNEDGTLKRIPNCQICSLEITGFRYMCVQCAEWEMCGSCDANGEHGDHYVLRMPLGRPELEMQMVLARVRKAVCEVNIVEVPVEQEDPLASDELQIKEEPQDEELTPTDYKYDSDDTVSVKIESQDDEIDIEESLHEETPRAFSRNSSIVEAGTSGTVTTSQVPLTSQVLTSQVTRVQQAANESAKTTATYKRIAETNSGQTNNVYIQIDPTRPTMISTQRTAAILLPTMCIENTGVVPRDRRKPT